MAEGYIIASIVFFILTLVSFLRGSYYVDKYVQLLKLTRQQAPFLRVATRIGIYLFILPAVFLFVAMKLIQVYMSASGQPIEVQSLTREMVTQTGGATLFLVSFGILLIVLMQVLLSVHQREKAIVALPVLIAFATVLVYFTQTIVISIMIASITTLGVIIFSYRRWHNVNEVAR